MMTDTIAIQISETTNSRLAELDFNNLGFGKQFSDHMFVAEYNNGRWSDFSIEPFGPIAMSPASSVIHYGQSIFEGLKAHRSASGDVLVFRPDANIQRLNQSAARMCMPEFPEDIFLEGLNKLLNLDRQWIPNQENTSMYIRPFMFATDAFLGVKPSDSYKMVIITSPSGAYYTAPVNVKVETSYSRTAKGGVGFAKAAGNYAASLLPAKLARLEGYDQLIWTDSSEHRYIEEAGTMNIMFVINGKLITPALSNTILPGITRNSLITIAKDWGMTVEERTIPVSEVIDAIKAGHLQEAFGVGTAATLAPIARIGFDGNEYELPELSADSFGLRAGTYLNDIKRGKVADPHNWIVTI